jgi:hypothetical protein
MWDTTTRRGAAVLLSLGCAVATAQTGALAAPHHHAGAGGHHKPNPKHHKVKKGFYVADQKSSARVTSSLAPAAVIDDSAGITHVVTTIKSPSGSGDQGRIVYYSRDKGATKWRSHAVPGLRPLAGGIKVQAGLSTDGNRVWAVFYECDGVFAASASVHAKRLPVPTRVQSADTCATATPRTIEPPIAQAVGGFGSLISVLLPDPAQLNNPAIWTGHPGSTFTPGPALPTTDSFVPTQITLSSGDEDFLAIGQGSDGVNQGVYVTKLEGNTWTAPTLIASLNSPTSDYRVESIVAIRGATYVGLARPGSHGGLFLVHGTSDGQWGGVIRLPHTTKSDTSLRLDVNQDTGHLHAAYTRHGSKKKAGIVQQARTKGWQKPKYYSHSGRDVAQQLVFNKAGQAVIGYLHR